MRKRRLLAVFMTFFALSLAGCGGTETQRAAQSTTEQTAVQEEQTAQEPEEPTAPADSGDLGDYHVTIGDVTYGEDYEGEKVVVVHYDFTNNASEAKAALFAINVKAFQDGVELETALVADDTVYDAAIAQKEIKSGVTLEDCQAAFVLSGTSDIEVEVTEFISFSDEKLVKTFKVQ